MALWRKSAQSVIRSGGRDGFLVVSALVAKNSRCTSVAAIATAVATSTVLTTFEVVGHRTLPARLTLNGC
jgi:hypothetical protein